MNQFWERLARLSPAKRELLLGMVKRDERLGRWMRGLGSPLEPKTIAQMAVEARLDDSIDPSSATPCRSAQNCVLLTGATGFLGAFLLAEILAQTQATVLCLVRAASEMEGAERIRRNLEFYELGARWDEGRIRPVLGDLARPLLGLSGGHFNQLAEDTDTIFHSGALVKWTYPYDGLRAANVFGTHEILRLAARQRVKPVHFISTVGVFASGDAQRRVMESDPLESSGPLYIGYAQSKWVAEKLVVHAAQRGLPASIYRPNIGPHSVTGVFNPSDHVSLMLKGCVQLGAAPNLDLRVSGAPVDYVAAAIVHLSGRPEALGRVFHLVNENDMTWSELCGWFSSWGYRISVEPYGTWRDLLHKALHSRQENALSGLSPFFSDDNVFDFVRLPAFDTAGARALLIPIGIECPPICERLLAVYRSYYQQSGFLPHVRSGVRPHSGELGRPR
jgi:thioester reductase-like protein